MLCQQCGVAKAVLHVTDRLPAGEVRDGHFCRACFDAGAATSGAEPAGDPPRLDHSWLATMITEAQDRLALQPRLSDDAVRRLAAEVVRAMARQARRWLQRQAHPGR